MAKDVSHAHDQAEQHTDVGTPAELPEQPPVVDHPVAKPAYESVGLALADRADADHEAMVEADRPDWRSDQWRRVESDLRRSSESRPESDEGVRKASAAIEPATDLIRIEGDLRYEIGTPEDAPDELDLDDDGSWHERLRRTMTKAETVDNLESSGDQWANLYEGLVNDRPRPSGAYLAVDDQPVVKQAPREAVDGGAVVLAPIALWVLADGLVRLAREQWNEWKSRGAYGYADN